MNTKFIFALITLTGFLLIAPNVHAKEIYESWGFEIRLSPYQPQIGDKLEQKTYQSFFGKGHPIIKSLELERYLTYFYGLFGVYSRFGHWNVSARSIKCLDTEGNTVECTTEALDSGDTKKGNDTTSFTIFPLSLGLVFRADILKRTWQIPLVISFKLGGDYYIWRMSDGGEIAKTNYPENRNGSGGTAGFHTGLGLSFNLDWISTGGKESSHSVFSSSYLFAEITRTWANNFGNKDKIDMSATFTTFGLAFDFE